MYISDADLENIVVGITPQNIHEIAHYLNFKDYSLRYLIESVYIRGGGAEEILNWIQVTPVRMMRLWVSLIAKPFRSGIDISNFLSTQNIEMTPEQRKTMNFLESVVSKLPGYFNMVQDRLFTTCSFSGFLYRGTSTELQLNRANQWFSRDFSVATSFGSNINVFRTARNIDKLLIQNFNVHCNNEDILPTPQIIQKYKVAHTNPCDQAEVEILNLSDFANGWINPLLEDQIFLTNPDIFLERIGYFIPDLFSGIEWLDKFIQDSLTPDLHNEDRFPLLDIHKNPIVIDGENATSFSQRLSLENVPSKILEGRTYEQVLAYILERYYDFVFEGDDQNYRQAYPDIEDLFIIIKNNNLNITKNLAYFWGELEDESTIYIKEDVTFYSFLNESWVFFYPSGYLYNPDPDHQNVEYDSDLDTMEILKLVIGMDLSLPFDIADIPHLEAREVGITCGDKRDNRILLGTGASGIVVRPNYPAPGMGPSNNLVSKIVKIDGPKNRQEIEFSEFLNDFDPDEEYFSRVLVAGDIDVCNIPYTFYLNLPKGFQTYINFIQTYHPLSKNTFDIVANTYNLYNVLLELWKNGVHQDLDVNIEYHETKKHLFVIDPGRGIVFGRNVPDRLRPYIETVNEILFVEDKLRFAASWCLNYNVSLRDEIITFILSDIIHLRMDHLEDYKELTDDLYEYGLMRVNQKLIKHIFVYKTYPMFLSFASNMHESLFSR